MKQNDITLREFPQYRYALNRAQWAGWLPAFACPNHSAHPPASQDVELGIMVATDTGWQCPQCDYRQDWAYRYMAEFPDTWRSLIDPEMLPEQRALMQSTVADQLSRALSGARYLRGIARNPEVVEILVADLQVAERELREYIHAANARRIQKETSHA